MSTEWIAMQEVKYSIGSHMLIRVDGRYSTSTCFECKTEVMNTRPTMPTQMQMQKKKKKKKFESNASMIEQTQECSAATTDNKIQQ